MGIHRKPCIRRRGGEPPPRETPCMRGNRAKTMHREAGRSQLSAKPPACTVRRKRNPLDAGESAVIPTPGGTRPCTQRVSFFPAKRNPLDARESPGNDAPGDGAIDRLHAKPPACGGNRAKTMHREAGRSQLSAKPPDARFPGSGAPDVRESGDFHAPGGTRPCIQGVSFSAAKRNPLDAWESRGNPASGDRTAGPLRAKPRMRGNRVKTMHPEAGYKPPSRETPGCMEITRKPASERRARSDPGSARELF